MGGQSPMRTHGSPQQKLICTCSILAENIDCRVRTQSAKDCSAASDIGLFCCLLVCLRVCFTGHSTSGWRPPAIDRVLSRQASYLQRQTSSCKEEPPQECVGIVWMSLLSQQLSHATSNFASFIYATTRLRAHRVIFDSPTLCNTRLSGPLNATATTDSLLSSVRLPNSFCVPAS
eukprot:TRINITY_DN22571_c2_g1_i1.p1 TRINITY_DN22571_c2_g1~~TRINITY_DN22571_c2_g1_i1.p1  ORF type:complete len:175 (+),score=12.79 TRINITY_DN22571_c2_g1_i1:213-737(+)